MSDRFALDALRDGVSEKLSHSDNPRVRSYEEGDYDDEGPFRPHTFHQSDYDRTEPDKDALRKYWRHYETVPFVRKSISSFARQVMEPGYYIRAEDVDQSVLEDLDHWLTNAAIIEGQTGQDFRQLAKKAIVQQEVRGTAFVEKAPDRSNEERLAGLKLINAETMEAVTRPNQSILLHPDDIDEYEDAPEAESGGAAAWLQDLGETESLFGRPVSDADVDDDYKIGFTRDEIIALRRDADVGEVFGTSRLEAASDRIEGLRQKLCDNDEAIASKAYPLWLFMFGSEENPWDSDDIDEFMKSHEMENFHPGMKQGVRGDVSVDTISGEVADIAESLQFDIDWIMSVMPIPKYALGVFTSAGTQVSRITGNTQQQQTQRQIKDARREIEEKFTPVVREVAMQNGVDEETAESIRLKVGSPGQPEPDVTPNENIIRYVPENQRNPAAPDQQPQGGADMPDNSRPAESSAGAAEARGAQLWHEDGGVAELGVSDRTALSDAIYETLVSARDEVLDEVGDRYAESANFAVTNFAGVANGILRHTLSRSSFRSEVRPVMEAELGVDSSSFTASNNVRFFVQNVEQATEDAAEEMLRLMRLQVRRGANQGDDWQQVRQRIEREYNDAVLAERAELIAHMELKNARETMKLQNWEQDDSVVGVRVVNENPSTPLTRSLDGAEAYFSEGDIQQQLAQSTRDEYLHQGFDPLPATPPFHFQDTSTLEPIYANEVN